jgi:predicted alpha/beta-fold hydrolase
MYYQQTPESMWILFGEAGISMSSTGNPAISLNTYNQVLKLHSDLTARIFNYATVGAYYRDASSVDNLLKIRVPAFIVHATDDPVCLIPFSKTPKLKSQIAVDEAVPYDEVKANPFCFMTTTSVGGHLSWFEVGGGRWFAKVVCLDTIPRLVCMSGEKRLTSSQVAGFFTKFANEVLEVNPMQDALTP